MSMVLFKRSLWHVLSTAARYHSAKDPIQRTSSLISRDENGMDIFRPYSRPNSFREVLIRPYPSLDI
jgi:AAA+ ATPase superfamily predicted ATPase